MPSAGSSKAKTVKASQQASNAEVFSELRGIFARHEGRLRISKDAPGDFHVDVAGATWRGKPLYFGGVKSGKNYISFHLMPVYAVPALMKGISPDLEQRMQGKACFNFKEVDSRLFAELAVLVEAGLDHYTIEYLQGIMTKYMESKAKEKRKKEK